jgi:hypothetical protein
MTARGSAGSNGRPASTRTRSVDVPSAPSGLATASSCDPGGASGGGRASEYTTPVQMDATCGSRASLL